MVNKPRRRRGRNMSGYIKGNVDESLSLGTLASAALIAGDFDESTTEKTLVSSLVATWSMDQLSLAQGPILVGVAHSSYSATQIEEVLEASASWARGSLVAQEVAKRLVRTIGFFVGDGSTVQDAVLNEGRPIKTKLNWMLDTGQTLQIWAFNRSDSALSITVPIIRLSGHANLWSR